jgi:hypothetical protein
MMDFPSEVPALKHVFLFLPSRARVWCSLFKKSCVYIHKKFNQNPVTYLGYEISGPAHMDDMFLLQKTLIKQVVFYSDCI